NNSGFGTYFRLPPRLPEGTPAFAPADLRDPRTSIEGYGPRGRFHQPFLPTGLTVLTRFTHGFDAPAPPAVGSGNGGNYPNAAGKVTHPCGAPDNHLLTAWSPGPANHQYNYRPYIDSGIYLIKEGKPVDEPGQMLLIKNDPKYNEQWPRP